MLRTMIQKDTQRPRRVPFSVLPVFRQFLRIRNCPANREHLFKEISHQFEISLPSDKPDQIQTRRNPVAGDLRSAPLRE